MLEDFEKKVESLIDFHKAMIAGTRDGDVVRDIRQMLDQAIEECKKEGNQIDEVFLNGLYAAQRVMEV